MHLGKPGTACDWAEAANRAEAPRRVARLGLAVLALAIASNGPAGTLMDGARLTRLTSDGKSELRSWAWHGDNVLIEIEVSDSQAQLAVMKSDGSDLRPITPIGDIDFAQWSWGGDRISYVFANTVSDESQASAYIYDLASGRTVQISAPYPQRLFDFEDGPTWSSDDRFVAYKIRSPDASGGAMWVVDTETFEKTQLLPGRGRMDDHAWSYRGKPRLCLQVAASGGGYDIATVEPDGRGLHLLTDIGAESVGTNRPFWSPADEWVTFLSDADMTRAERGRGLADCWIARPDGSEARNLTNATTAATERQLDLGSPIWSWDGRWILSEGDRFDTQGNEIETVYLIDPVEGGYETLLTSDPERTGQIRYFTRKDWSYDSKRVAITSVRYRIRNWGDDPEREDRRTALSILDLETRELRDVLELSSEQDREEIGYNISWSPDSQSVMLTIEKIISRADEITQPDVYRLDLPSVVAPREAARIDGPPVGRGKAPTRLAAAAAPSPRPSPASLSDDGPPPVAELTLSVSPKHLTVEEALESLPVSYTRFLTSNGGRNLFLFHGPEWEYRRFVEDLALIDSPAPHILVDMLAIELSDDANRELGLDWTHSKGRFAFFGPEGFAIRDITPEPSLRGIATYPGVGQAIYQGVGKLPREFLVRLSLLEKDGAATILANPRNVSESGKESRIEIRKTVNFFFTEGYDFSGRPIVKKSDISADTTGRITPILLPDGRISMSVDVSVGTFTFTPEEQLPELTTRQSKTEVTIGDGDTIVIGGLRQQALVTVESRVPVLGHIPLIGRAFRKTRHEVRHSVLTIMITPRVLEPGQREIDWPRLNGNGFEIEPIMDDETIRHDMP